MAELIQQNWILFVIALVIAIALVWWIFVASRKTRVETTSRDTLDEGAEPAKRNQALIDAPPAAGIQADAGVPPATPAGMAGVGEAVAAASEPVHEQAESDEPAPAEQADDLKQIKGIGPKLETTLHSLGVNSFAQIADWDEAEIDRIDAQLGKFQGRIRRDRWPEQARFLASGDQTGFESQFGKA